MMNYNPENNQISITIGDITETLDLVVLLDKLPQDIELIRLHWLMSEIHRIRQERVKNLGNYMDKILELTRGEARARTKMEELAENRDHRGVKAYGDIVKAYLAEKNTISEYRYAQTALANEEGRLALEISKLEV